jgi:hypothetical protein
MPRRARIVTWNGKNIPPELLDLPAGRYVVDSVKEEPPVLTPEERAGIEAALESYRQGRVVDAKPPAKSSMTRLHSVLQRDFT